jgi:hypothetical protein
MRVWLRRILAFLCISVPVGLIENAVLGWTGDQIAAYFGLTSPSIAQVLDFIWNIGMPALVAGVALFGYHLWWSKHAGMPAKNPGLEVQRLKQVRLQDKQTRTRKYSEAEAAKRLAIYDQLYQILNGTCSNALDLGTRTGANWENQIVNSGSLAYIRKLKEFREVANNALQEISVVLKRYEYYPDIQGMFHNTWGRFQSVLWEAITELTQTLQPPFPEKPEKAIAHLLEPRGEKFVNGVHLFGEWITETKAAIAAKVRELGSD